MSDPRRHARGSWVRRPKTSGEPTNPGITGARRSDCQGFTLVEMLVAMGILVFGLTALIGALGIGVDTRRTAEMRNRAVNAADAVFQHLEQKVLANDLLEDDLPPLATVKLDEIPGYPQLRARVDFVTDEEHPALVLAKVHIGWLSEGEVVGETFHRVLAQHIPFQQRILKIRSDR